MKDQCENCIYKALAINGEHCYMFEEDPKEPCKIKIKLIKHNERQELNNLFKQYEELDK